MDLALCDVIDLLDVSEETVRRWIAGGSIPSYQLDGQPRFSRIEIENWMLQSGFPHGQREGKPVSHHLYRAIHRGKVHTIAADSKEGVIREGIGAIAAPLELDAPLVTELFLDRERLMPTALGNGVAVPHTREFLLKGPHDVIALVYPEKPLKWGALDGEEVHTLFFLFACDDKRHLTLLARIAHLAANDEAGEFLRSRPPLKGVLDYIKQWEHTLSK
jgi:PTS system nitrogen regulatory IIA component